MIEIIEYCLKIYIPIWFLKNCSKYMRKYNKGNIMYFFSIGYKYDQINYMKISKVMNIKIEVKI